MTVENMHMGEVGEIMYKEGRHSIVPKLQDILKMNGGKRNVLKLVAHITQFAKLWEIILERGVTFRIT